MHEVETFERLTPDVMLDMVEDAIEQKLTGLAHPHPSYINRVYELQTFDGERLIAKFYRPGRWTEEAIREEHDFVIDCEEEGIPVIAPDELPNGDTLGGQDGLFFAVYPKRWGRSFEVKEEEDWRRIGRCMARMHVIGEKYDAEHRIVMHPQESTREEIRLLLDGDHVNPSCKTEFEDVTSQILELITPPFEGAECIRIHGDCHAANVLERPDEGVMIIDFDDMAMGPPVQDLWMLLPGNREETKEEQFLLLEGYEDIRFFEPQSFALLEPLRIMRMLYFLSWSAMQSNDPGFQHQFPDWGGYNFWQREITDLRMQLQNIKDGLEEPRPY